MNGPWERLLNERPGALLQEEASWRRSGVLLDLSIGDQMRRRAESNPEAILFVAGDETLRCGDLLLQAEALAAALYELGLRPGDVISCQLPNWPETAVINLAACLLGLVCNPITTIYRDTEVAMMLADCHSRAIFCPGEFRGHDFAAMMGRLRPQLPELRAIIGVRDQSAGTHDYSGLCEAGQRRSLPPVEIDPKAIKLIMYTSGTTGGAKGVLHSHETVSTVVGACKRSWSMATQDIMLMPSPVTHITGYVCGLEMSLLYGTRTVLMERWDASQAVSLINQHGVTATVGATPFLKELLDAAVTADSDLPSLRLFACGGAAIPPQLVRNANRHFRGHTFRIYGSTEAPLIGAGLTNPADLEQSAESDGQVFDYEIRIQGDNGDTLPRDREGEILARGPALFLGYTNPLHTHEAFDEDGYFRSGDLGIHRQDNCLVITGRKKDLIIRGGENISAREIEDVLHRHPGVKEAAVVAMPHERMGETVCAYLIPAPGALITHADIIEFIARSGLARQKYPEHLELIEDFPRTASGKVRKDILRKMIAASVLSAPEN